jgi:hypothetical protein
MGLHLHYDLAADSGADPIALLEPLRSFALTLPFASVSDLVRGPHPLGYYYGSDWELRLDEQGQIRPHGWMPGDGNWYGDAVVRATEWTCFRIDPGLGCEEAFFGLARHPATWPVEGQRQPTGLDQSWRWHCSCKTSVASRVSSEHFMRCHGSLVSVLDFAVGLGLVAEVTDETGFWEHRDWKPAFGAVDSMYELMANVLGLFSGPAGSEAWQQAVTDLRRKLPPEPSGE